MARPLSHAKKKKPKFKLQPALYTELLRVGNETPAIRAQTEERRSGEGFGSEDMLKAHSLGLSQGRRLNSCIIR